MEIKKEYQNCNDQTCIERSLKIPKSKVKTERLGWGERATEEEKKKYFDIIENEIDYEEETLESKYSTIWCDYVLFEITTRENWRIELENKIKKILGMKKDDELDIDEEGWIHIWGSLSKKKLQDFESKLPITDWKVYDVRDWGSMIDLQIDFNKLE